MQPGDAQCGGKGDATNFPERVAEGGLFDVDYRPFSSKDVSAFDIATVSRGIIEEHDDVLIGAAPGLVAIVAKRTADGRILDFVHLRVVKAGGLRMTASGSSPRLTWHTGAVQTLRAVPLDGRGLVLAGALDYGWTTSDEAVVRLERQSPASEMELLPRAPGKATITVRANGATGSLDVTVEGTPVVDPPLPGEGDGGAPLADGGRPTRDAGNRAPDAEPGDALPPPSDAAVEGGNP